MRIHEAICEGGEKSIYLYGDPEFAIYMWEEVEADVEVEDSEMVVRLSLRKGDKLIIEWLGMEVIEDEVVNYLELSQDYGMNTVDHTTIRYKGWIPACRLTLQDGSRDGLKILRANHPN